MISPQEAEAGVNDVRRSRPYHVLVGVGLVSYGVIHLVVAWIALPARLREAG